MTVEGANGDERAFNQLEPRGRRRRRRLLRALPRHDVRAGEGRPALRNAPDDPADASDPRRRRGRRGARVRAARRTPRSASPCRRRSRRCRPSRRSRAARGPRPRTSRTPSPPRRTVASRSTEAGAPFAVHRHPASRRTRARRLLLHDRRAGARREAPAGSASTPGMRTTSIVWAGFNPGERLLVARATLEPAKAVAALPIRIRVSGETVTLENTTGISVGSFSADAPRAPLVAYLTRLRAESRTGGRRCRPASRSRRRRRTRELR